MRPVLGFIGLGTMGAPLCRRLLRSGCEVVVCDADPRRAADLRSDGATPAESVAVCAAAADVLLTSLPLPAAVHDVMVDGGALAALRPGATWVDLTTNRPALLTDLAARAPADVSVVDAPVTGAVDGARTGTVTLFVGGTEDAVRRVTPVLAHLGTVIACGGLGTGTVVKLVTNQLWFVAAAALGEGFAVGMTHGVDLGVLWRAIRASVADSFVARHDAPSVFAGHYDPSFSLELCVKDLRLLDELEADVGTDLPLTAAARAAFSEAAARYGGAAGELHVARRIEDDTGLSFRYAGDWIPPWEVADEAAGPPGTDARPDPRPTH